MAATVQGIEALTVVLEDLQALDLGQALGQAGALVERGAKMKCPKDLGNLARSIQYEVEGNTCTVSAPLEYAPYVEYGTGLLRSREAAKRPGRTRTKRAIFTPPAGNARSRSSAPPSMRRRRALCNYWKGSCCND